MNRDRILTAIKNLQKHALNTDEQHLIAYLKINLGNLFELEDDRPAFESLGNSACQKLEFLAKNLDNSEGGGGLEIKFPGFEGNPQCPEDSQLFIEYSKKKINIHVWNGNQDPITTKLEPK